MGLTRTMRWGALLNPPQSITQPQLVLWQLFLQWQVRQVTPRQIITSCPPSEFLRNPLKGGWPGTAQTTARAGPHKALNPALPQQHFHFGILKNNNNKKNLPAKLCGLPPPGSLFPVSNGMNPKKDPCAEYALICGLENDWDLLLWSIWPEFRPKL